MLRARGVQERAAPLRDRRRAVAARLDLLLLHQRRRRRRRSSSTCRPTTSASARRSPATAASSRRPSDGAVATRLTAPTFRQLIESRDAQFGALAGVAFAEGIVVREPVQRSGPAEARAMNIGMVCYASVGGSGVVATELAHALALRGHDVHLISSEPPFRWRDGVPGLSFERVAGAAVPAVSRAAVPAGAGQHHRARRARSGSSTSSTPTTRCRTRRRPTWPTRCSPSAPGRHARRAPSRRCTAPTSRWSAATRRTRARRGVLDRAVARRDRGVARACAPTPSRALGVDARHPRHSQLPRLRRVSPAARSRRCARGCVRRNAATRWSSTSRTSGRSSASTWRSRCSASSGAASARASC